MTSSVKLRSILLYWYITVIAVRWWRCARCRCSCWSSCSWYAPTVDEEHVWNNIVDTYCKHSWSLTVARAAGGGNAHASSSRTPSATCSSWGTLTTAPCASKNSCQWTQYDGVLHFEEPTESIHVCAMLRNVISICITVRTGTLYAGILSSDPDIGTVNSGLSPHMHARIVLWQLCVVSMTD